MKCPHCQTDYFADWFPTPLVFDKRTVMTTSIGSQVGIDPKFRISTCASCRHPVMQLHIEHEANSNILYSAVVYPRGGSFPAAPSEVPAHIANDYAEANEVLTISPKASAALSRRCFQNVLSAQGYIGRDLVKQVEAVLNETDASKSLPTPLRENIDAIRNFGNFSAHPITDLTTLQVVDVEEGEAEWCLQLILDLFDYYYVAPAKAATRRAALAAKLAGAGKPPMKQ